MFKVEDLVFARVKGFRPWPGRILELTPNKKAKIFFFGSYDTGLVNIKDIWIYDETTKTKYTKPNEKNKSFLKALEEIVESPDLLPFVPGLPEESEQPPKKKPKVDQDDDTHRKIWVQVKDTGDIIEVNLDKDRPKYFATIEEAQQWDDKRARDAIKFKQLVETGKYMPQEVIDRLKQKEDITEKEKALIDKWAWLEDNRAEKIQWLKTESRVSKIDLEIKKFLHPDHSDVPQIHQLLQELNKLLVSKLMLKKQPQVMETVSKLCNFVGPPNTTDNELKDKIKSVRTLANAIFVKWQSFFEDLPDTDFMLHFELMIKNFQCSVRDMPIDKLRFMVCE